MNRTMKLMHLPASRLGVGDVLVVAGGEYQLPISLEIWNLLKDEHGVIRLYVRESTTCQVCVHEHDVVAVLR